MERFRRLILHILFPGFPVILVSVLTSAVLLAYTFLCHRKYSVAGYASYMFSAYTLVIACVYIFGAVKPRIRLLLYKNRHVRRYLTDHRFKMHVSLYVSLGINLVFILIKLFYGIWCRSVWYGTLSVYYVLLAVMYYLLVHSVKHDGMKNSGISGWKRYRLCGIILMLMNIILMGMSVLVVLDNESFFYTGDFIYIAAMYDFYNITASLHAMIRRRSSENAVLSAAKAIRMTTALVSMLSLETAMLAQFDRGDGPPRRLITGLTGGAVCLIVFLTAAVMIVHGERQLNKLRNTERRRK